MWGWGSLEADFARFYSMDLNDEVHSGQLTWRRFQVLLSRLPADGAWGCFLEDKTGRSLVDISAGGIRVDDSGALVAQPQKRR